jgi:ubiquinone/menaquinone biosynthesis C-methylase UbiE
MTGEIPRDQVVQSDRLNFVDFARDREYREANRVLLRQAFESLPSPFFHVDVASGTGLVAQEVCALCEGTGKAGTVIGIDPDPFAVRSARESTPSTAHCTVDFLEGRAQEMDRLLAGRLPPQGADYVSIHDAIHEIEEEDKASILLCVARILKPGGLFSYNSAFTTAAMEQTAMQWGKWKAKAFSLLGGKRNRRVTGLVTHSPEEYREMIASAGLAIVHEAKRSVCLSRSALEAIARYPRFVWGVFADYVGEEMVPLEEKSQALIRALDDLGISELSRVWHELVARKPLTPSEAGSI